DEERVAEGKEGRWREPDEPAVANRRDDAEQHRERDEERPLVDAREVVAEDPEAAVQQVRVVAQVRGRERVPEAEDVRDVVPRAPDEPRDARREGQRDRAPERQERAPRPPGENAQDRKVEDELEDALRLD